MRIDDETSPNLIDRRKVASHGLAWILGLLIGGMAPRSAPPSDPDRDLVSLASTALDRAQTFWRNVSCSNDMGACPWIDARVVIFDGATSSPCGQADASTGPFYCPVDRHVYVDLSFLRAIRGDLARAYVIAHEIGHHVQEVRGRLDARPSVVIELEADCYAGRWMAEEQRLGDLATGDIEGALAEAAAVGDDRLCPGCSRETWTHGSSAQRVEAVRAGIAGGCP